MHNSLVPAGVCRQAAALHCDQQHGLERDLLCMTVTVRHAWDERQTLRLLQSSIRLTNDRVMAKQLNQPA